METFVFATLSLITLASALSVVLLRNTLHAALMLGLSLMGVAGLFGTLGADFLFAGQIIIYVTGVAVLVLFVVMLSGRHSELLMRQTNERWPLALAVAAVVGVGLWRIVSLFFHDFVKTPFHPTTRELGALLLGRYALPFELISLILIAALIGAILFSRAEERS